MNELRINIRRVWERTPDITRDAGRKWYPQARHEAQAIARTSRHSLRRVCGVIAALSPNVQWEVNIREARAVCLGKDRPIAAYPANLEKARRILAGERVLKVLGGPKTRAFFACILSGGRGPEVTIDGHAVNIAEAQLRPLRDVGPYLKKIGAYDRYAHAYREVAAEVSENPITVQAATWLQWRIEA